MKTLGPFGMFLTLAAALLVLPGLSCQPQKPSAPGGPAKEKPRAESDLAFATLSQEQVKSLGIMTKKIPPQTVQDHFELTGWIVAKQGHEVTITAAVAGYIVELPTTLSLPFPGQDIQAKQLLFRIRPVLSPVEKIQLDLLRRGVEQDLSKAKVNLANAKVEFVRLEPLVKIKTQPRIELEKLQERIKHALADQKAAEDRLKLFGVPPWDVTSPRTGKVAQLHVSAGQYVPAGSPLITILDFHPLWVRVPIPEHDLPQVERTQAAEVVLRSSRAGSDKNAKTAAGESRSFPARLQAVVPWVDPQRYTVDLIYELSSPSAAMFAKDMIVTVYVPQYQKRQESVVPLSTLVRDARGGSWLYLDRGKAKSGKQQYERRRVELGARLPNGVAVRPPLTATDLVVTVGAAVEKTRANAEPILTTLAQDEVASLSIQTQKVTLKPVQETFELTGWVAAKQGNEVMVTASVAGYVLQPSESLALPIPGQEVKHHQPLLRIRPVLSAVEAIQLATLKRNVELDLAKAEVTFQNATKQYNILKPLVEQKLKQQQELEQMKVRVDLAVEDKKSAQDRLHLFTIPIATITAPRAGKVALLHVSGGQYVAAGAPLVTLVDLKPLWVRVPVPEQDLPDVDRAASANILVRASKANTPFASVPKALVPVVDPTRHTVDMLYELPSLAEKSTWFSKDQMVTVHVPLGQLRSESVVPYSAIVFDAHAGAWIYLDRGQAKSGKQQYERRRVEVGARVNGGVVVRPTLAAEEQVVIFGAGVLFSREFYQPPVNSGK